MANEQSPERPQVTEGQRGQRIVKIEVADLTHGQRPKDGAKTVPGPTSGPPMTSLPPAPPTSQQVAPPPTQPQAAPSAEKK